MLILFYQSVPFVTLSLFHGVVQCIPNAPENTAAGFIIVADNFLRDLKVQACTCKYNMYMYL